LKVLGVIPARFASTRLRGKVLMRIGGKSMIQHVWERASRARFINRVVIATDDDRVYRAALAFGAEAKMTSTSHTCGTERVEEAARGYTADIVVNIQGDEPFIRPEMIDEAIEPLLRDPMIPMGTVMRRILSEEELADPGVVKAVVDKEGFALYFSRSLIPYPMRKEGFRAYEHLGVYAYRKDFLTKLVKMSPTPLEMTENLEMLRALENGYRIKVVATEHPYDALSVDTLEDLKRARRIYRRMSGAGGSSN